MAAPSYTEDLTDIDLFESGSTGVTEINFSGGGGAATAFGADLGMQGAGCWDRQVSSHERGVVVNKTPGTGTVATGVHIFQWGFVATPGITDTLATRGAYVLCGTGTGAIVQFHVEGNDTYGAQGRVGKCYPYRYVTSANTGSIPYRTVTGSPGATPTYFGFGIKTTAAAKGSNLGCDAVRYGTGAYLTAGELISAGDGSDDPCTFRGFSTQNDAISNRWGILTSIGGASYELQGRFVIGQNNAGTATLCRFRGADINLLLVDTVHSETDFTRFVIDHASTRCEWSNVNITALGTHNPGQIIVNSANPVFTVEGGSWTDIGTVLLRSNTTLDGVTARGTDQITQNSAAINSSVFDGTVSTAHILSDDPELIDDCDFFSDGSGHGVRCDTAGTYDWSNRDTGYTGTRGSNGTSSSGSADAMFYNNSGGLITLNVIGTGQAPSVRNGAGATTVVNASVPVVYTFVDDSTGSVIEGVNVILTTSGGSAGDVIDNVLSNASGVVSVSYPGSTPVNVSGFAAKGSEAPTYKRRALSGTIASGTGLSQTIRMQPD